MAKAQRIRKLARHIRSLCCNFQTLRWFYCARRAAHSVPGENDKSRFINSDTNDQFGTCVPKRASFGAKASLIQSFCFLRPHTQAPEPCAAILAERVSGPITA